MSPRPLTRLIIAGGGTGGHIYPGVAIAEEVRTRNPAAEVTFIGSARGMETRILPALGYPIELITVSRLKGGGFFAKLRGLLRLPIGIFQSWRLLRRLRPEVVIGVGGYASGPMLLAAWLTRRPTAIQEQNAHAGLTNRWLGKLVRKVFLGFAAAQSPFSAAKTTFTGNPIRAAIAAQLHGRTVSDAPPAPFRVLIFGGSQGARFLNTEVPGLLALVANSGLSLIITHQTGPSDVAATEAAYAALGLPATVLPFIDDMAQAYASADLAICRSGALTLAELTAVALPSVLVPFPHAADNHQEANARVLADAGAALLAPQATFDAPALAERLRVLATTPGALRAMSLAAASLARTDAAATITTHLEELAA